MMTNVSVGFTLPVVSVLDPDSDELKLGIRNTVTNPEKPKKVFPKTEKVKKYVLYLVALFICDTVTINTCYYY
jgi:hypothetical protein